MRLDLGLPVTLPSARPATGRSGTPGPRGRLRLRPRAVPLRVLLGDSQFLHLRDSMKPLCRLLCAGVHLPLAEEVEKL